MCGGKEGLGIYEVPFSPEPDAAGIHACASCRDQFADAAEMHPQHWRFLSDTMWSEVAAVQVMAWRMLKRLHEQAWARDLLDMLYLDETTLAWAMAGAEEMDPQEDAVLHVDSNGAVLAAGDDVVLTKDLPVKGGGFTAKRGTAVRGIALVHDNPEHIEGRVQGQKIVILTKFVKRS
jgi:protein PhnA